MTTRQTAARGRARALLVVLLVAAAFRFVGLGYPTEEYFDEVYHAKTALQYLNGEPPTEWVHPPTSKLLIAVGVWAFGYQPWAWRLAPALAGTLLAGVFLLLARRVLESERAALIATGLLLTDGVYLVQSRIAMTNVFAVLFQLLSALLVLRAGGERRLRVGQMAAAGVALGLALSTRWTSLWAWGFLALVMLAQRAARRREPAADPEAPPIGSLGREAALLALAFVVLPGLVYLLSYVPLMLQSHPRGLDGWGRAVLDTVRAQREIWRYHANLRATHAYFSRWWTWPFLYRPTWYYWWSGPGVVRGIVALGNPAIWWASLPACAWALVSGLRGRDARRLFAGAGFFLLYLPWGLSPRTLNFSHYLFEAIPYACLALAFLLDRAWDGPRRYFAWAYLTTAGVLFLHFLPLLTALPVPASLWAARIPVFLQFQVWGLHFQLGGAGLWTWFPSWI
jgi:dolichyl-phosphate-mannose-protein mannosyltransferase